MRELAQLRPVVRGLFAGTLAALLAAACSQGPQPQPVKIKDTPATTPAEATDQPAAEPFPSQPSSSTQPPSVPSSTQPSSAASDDKATEPPDPTLVVIDPGGPGPDEDIVAAARTERERRAKAPPASKSITNKNLVKSQESKPTGKASGKSAAKPGAGKPVTKPAAAGEAGSAVHDGSDEAYWRGRSLELRELWKQAVDQIADLERDADGLRRRFYAESDSYVRDTRVKPDWDRVLDRIREMQAEAERRRQELRDHLEQGRRAGALPGWLREGIELEPPAPPDHPEAGEHQAVEPPVYTQPPLEPPPHLLGAWR